jgi:hypothetical protein
LLVQKNASFQLALRLAVAAVAAAVAAIASATAVASASTATTTAIATASAATTTAVATAPPATTASAFALRTGFVDHQSAAHEFAAVERGNCFFRFGIIIDFGETETARLSRETIAEQSE